MPAAFSTHHQGQRIEVVPDSLWERDRIRLLVDGEPVDETKAHGPKTRLKGEDFEIRAVTPLWGGSVTRAELVPIDGGEPIALEPEPGTRAAKRARFEREHPNLYAARHVVKGAAQVALALVGLTFLLSLIPRHQHRPPGDPMADHRPAGHPVAARRPPAHRDPATGCASPAVEEVLAADRDRGLPRPRRVAPPTQ